MNKELYIRTDANSVLGIGHVMRCKTIAEEWIKAGGICTFLVADEESSQVVQQMGFSSICLHGRWNDLEHETQALLSCIKKHQIKRLFIDSYYVSPTYLSSLNSLTKIIYMGPANEQLHPVDMLINYNIAVDADWYNTTYGENVIKLLGCNYFPLRQEFKNSQITIHSSVKNLLIMTGGSDACHMALQLSNLLLQHTNFTLHVVIGAFNPDREPLQHIQETNPRLHLYQNVQNMAELMMKCDIAISAGGVTLYELCACGLPAITYAFADNQLGSIQEFKRQNLMESIGDIRTQDTDVWQASLMKILNMYQDNNTRKQMADKIKDLVDGDGAKRIVESILLHC